MEFSAATHQTKRLHLEVLRIIACFFVVFNHTGNNGFFLFASYSADSVRYWVYLFLSIFCKFSVPLFFAISGGLLLPKEESIKEVYRHRVLKFFVLLFVSSVGYYLIAHKFDFSSMSLIRFIGRCYTSTQKFHLWYFYAFISFLMSLPLLRPMVKGMKNKHILYMLAAAFFFTTVLPLFELFAFRNEYSLNSNFRLNWITSSIVLYPVAGYYIENRMDAERARKYVPYLWLADILLLALTCVASDRYIKLSGICEEGTSELYFNSTALINMITIYI